MVTVGLIVHQCSPSGCSRSHPAAPSVRTVLLLCRRDPLTRSPTGQHRPRRPHPLVGQHAHGHVRARRLAAHHLQHAVPLDLRQQRRGHHGPVQVPGLLSVLRPGGDRGRRWPSTAARRRPTIGASGAIAGVLGAYILLFPRARVLTVVPIFLFFPILYVPAWVMLGIWFGLQLVQGYCQPGWTDRRGVLRAHRRLRRRVRSSGSSRRPGPVAAPRRARARAALMSRADAAARGMLCAARRSGRRRDRRSGRPPHPHVLFGRP